jgi:hypothetical protein
MIILRRGDHLPTVGVLQSFLNQQPSTGEFLSVDGAFGGLTAGAVSRFRVARRLGANEVADVAVWNGVVGPDWQVIDSVDRSDHDRPRHVIEDHLDLGPFGQTILEQFGMTNGAPLVISRVRGAARSGQVVLLRFHGHGSPGHMVVASGTRGNTASSFDVRYGQRFFDALRVLRPIFAPFGSVEMHGCRVAQGTLGRRLLRGMADAMGVPVSAGLTTQHGGGRTTFRFEGPTLTICPNGVELAAWLARVGNASFRGP